MLTGKVILGFLFYVIGHIFAWYQFNSQFVWDWAKLNLLVPVFIFAIPMGLCFLYGTKLLVEETNELWTARFVGFGASYAIFPALTWYYMNESMFTFKTISCLFLACAILYIQLFLK
tara:strand:- start:19 stop:369 length:351 start_codon:yes stop_codon:yes gene_type:complete